MTGAPPSTGLEHDPTLPSRDLLLDPASVAERLGQLCGVGDDPQISNCRLRRVKYRIGESLRVVYDVRVGDADFVMSARTFADSGAVYREAAKTAGPVGAMPGVLHDPEWNAVWWTVPNDRKMTNLTTLLDAPERIRQATGVAWDRSVLVEYAPERSATARVLDARGGVVGYAKAYRDRDVLEIADNSDRVATAMMAFQGVRTPRAIGWARMDRIIVLEAMPGVTWHQLPPHERPGSMRRFGSALASVHGVPVEGGRGPFQRYRLERVLNSAALVAVARPDVAVAARRLADRLSAGPPDPSSSVSLHGDAHFNNVLFHRDLVHLIDFDQGGSGTAAADLGSVLASLKAARLINPGADTGQLAAEFLAGYRSVRALPTEAELRWYTAAAFLVERAIRAVNRIYVPTLAVLAELLELGESTLVGSESIDE